MRQRWVNQMCWILCVCKFIIKTARGWFFFCKYNLYEILLNWSPLELYMISKERVRWHRRFIYWGRRKRNHNFFLTIPMWNPHYTLFVGWERELTKKNVLGKEYIEVSSSSSSSSGLCIKSMCVRVMLYSTKLLY